VAGLQELVDAVTSVGVHEEAAHFFAQRIFRHLFEVSAAATTPLGAKRACSFYTSCLRHLVRARPARGCDQPHYFGACARGGRGGGDYACVPLCAGGGVRMRSGARLHCC